MLQAIGDRAGEAAAWHNLASIDLNEGNYAAAREKFGTALAMFQAIGDLAGEASTYNQVGILALKVGNGAVAVRLVAIGTILLSAVGAAEIVWENLTGMAAELGLDQRGLDALLHEAADHYQQDRGAKLMRQAFENL
jgi:hypothetical protein